jgi:hypothetical protein
MPRRRLDEPPFGAIAVTPEPGREPMWIRVRLV